MKEKTLQRNLSQIYLTAVPVLTLVIGLGVGYSSYKIYLPIWIINVFLMTGASLVLGRQAIRSNDTEKKTLVACALFFIIPMMLVSMFSGLGPPPFGRPAEWVASANEQRVRYYFLFAVGILNGFAFAILKEKLKKTGGNFYSLLGSVAVQIAIPIFLINMTFWGFYLAELYRSMAESSTTKTPDWVLPLATQFYYTNMIVAALVYVATAAFAAALKKAGWFRPVACNIYIIISGVFFLLDILPPSLPEPFATLSYIVSIPAVPFFMPYFMGVHLLKGSANGMLWRSTQ
jgi:hypothetical protein